LNDLAVALAPGIEPGLADSKSAHLAYAGDAKHSDYHKRVCFCLTYIYGSKRFRDV